MNAPVNHTLLALHEAQHAYEAAQREASTACSNEIEADLESFGLMAEAIKLCVSRCWKLYGATNDDHDRREFTTSEVAEQIAEVLSEAFGLSREASAVLSSSVKG